MNKSKRFRCFVFTLIIITVLMISTVPVQNGLLENASAGKYGNIVPTLSELELLKKINDNRTAQGAPQLKLNATLWWAARAHSQDMIDYDFFDHTSSVEGQFNGATFNERVLNYAGYQNGYVGECIAMKSSGIDPEWCMAAWKNSPPHWDIIINPNLKEVGLGLLQGEWDGISSAGLYTADFGGAAINVDLEISGSNILFSPPSPIQGQNVTITALINNLGNTDAFPVVVKFYDGDPSNGGTQIGDNTQVPHILIHDEQVEVSVIWSTKGKSGDHDIYVVVDSNNLISEPNEQNNIDSKSITITVPDILIHLEEGWNLCSFPHIISDPSLNSVLFSISGTYDLVSTYDSFDSDDPWKSHVVQKTESMNNLYTLNNKMGFWIHITNPMGADLVVAGDLPSSPQCVSLAKGWNLVGYPSQSEKLRDLALNNLEFDNHVDSIQYYDTETSSVKELNEGDYLKPGVGYWFHALDNCEWIVGT